MSRTPFALVAVMLLLALTACGGAEPDEGGTSGYPFRLRIEPGAGGDLAIVVVAGRVEERERLVVGQVGDGALDEDLVSHRAHRRHSLVDPPRSRPRGGGPTQPKDHSRC